MLQSAWLCKKVHHKNKTQLYTFAVQQTYFRLKQGSGLSYLLDQQQQSRSFILAEDGCLKFSIKFIDTQKNSESISPISQSLFPPWAIGPIRRSLNTGFQGQKSLGNTAHYFFSLVVTLHRTLAYGSKGSLFYLISVCNYCGNMEYVLGSNLVQSHFLVKQNEAELSGLPRLHTLGDRLRTGCLISWLS